MARFDAARLQMMALARDQQGVISLPQLRACGLTDDVIRGLVSRGELRRRHRGVYLVGPILAPASREMAAVLACGPRAVVSHQSAGHLHGILLRPPTPGPVHVTIVARHRRGDTRIVVHETASLRPYEIRDCDGIPVTAPIRTLTDLAGVVGDEELERAVAEAFALGKTNPRALRRAALAARGRRGVARLLELLDSDRRPRRTRSPPERRLLAAIRAAGLPEPETNVQLGRWNVDFLWRRAGLVVEVDAYSTHSSPWAFERDRRKDVELSARGLTVRRFTARQVREELDAVLARIREALDRPAL